MATAAYSVTITATAPDQQTADALRLIGLRRFVREHRGVLPQPGVGEQPLDPMTMAEEELLPYAELALQAFIRDSIVADAARDADALRGAAVEQAQAQVLALAVSAEVLP